MDGASPSTASAAGADEIARIAGSDMAALIGMASWLVQKPDVPLEGYSVKPQSDEENRPTHGAIPSAEEQEEIELPEAFADGSGFKEDNACDPSKPPLVEADYSDSSYDDADEEPSGLEECSVEELIDRLIEVELQAADAQEALEEESLARVRNEVRDELREELESDELEDEVDHEMRIFTKRWEEELASLLPESAKLQELLDNEGVSLPPIFKEIDKLVAERCTTDAWKKRAHWVGQPASSDCKEAQTSAERDLNVSRPLLSRKGKLVEAGASGFLEQKIKADSGQQIESDALWNALDGVKKHNIITTKEWAAVYAAATPEQAARLGIKFRGADKVDELGDIGDNAGLLSVALEEETKNGLTDEQRRNVKKVREEDDVRLSRHVYRVPLSLSKPSESEQQTAPRPRVQVAEVQASSDVKFSSEVQAHAEITAPSEAKEMEISAEAKEAGTSKENLPREVNFSTERAGARQPVAAMPEVIVLSDDEGGDFKESISPVPGNSSRTVPSEPISFVQDVPSGSGKDEATFLGSNYGKRRCSNDELLSTKGPKLRRIATDDSDEDNVPAGEVPTTKAKEVIEAFTADTSTIKPPRRRSSRGSKDYACTICEKAMACKDVVKHPLLDVPVCMVCKYRYEECEFQKDEDGSEAQCRWCTEYGDLVCCGFCDKAFCRKCVERNLRAASLTEILEDPIWACLFCDPSQIAHLTNLLRHAVRVSQPSSVVKTFEIQPSSIRRRKNIKKIIPDALLSSETKKKLDEEADRRERLDRWYKHHGMTGPARDELAAVEEKHICEGDCANLGCVINIANREPSEPIIRIPLTLSQRLKPHQLCGIRFIWENCIQSISKVKSGSSGLGCILAHCMGLGKTIQIVAFLYTVMRAIELGFTTALVVLPVNVLHNWRTEFTKWQPKEVKELPVYMLEDVSRDNTERANLLKSWKTGGGVLLMGYAAFRRLSTGQNVKDPKVMDLLRECLQQPGPDILVCDEAHTIKNSKADITQALRNVRTKRRIALTGSPLQNNLMEYFCMVNFVREGYLGSLHEFKNRYQNPIANGQHADSTPKDVRTMKRAAHILHKSLSGFVQRKDMAVLKNELPPKWVWVISIKLTPLQKALYKKYLTIRDQSMFDIFHNLSKVWNHPELLRVSDDDFIVETEEDDSNDDIGDLSGKNVSEQRDWWREQMEGVEGLLEHSGKMLITLRIIALSAHQGEKVLIFSQSLGTLDLLEGFLSKVPGGKNGCWKSGREWYRIDGSTSSARRQRIVDLFNDPDNVYVKCVLISTRAGSLGINLVGATRVVIMDGSWNPTYDVQAIFRAWRIGQTKPVHAYRLLAYGTMEEKIYNRQLTKEGTAARVLDAHQVGRHLNAGDLDLSYELDDDDSDDDEEENEDVAPNKLEMQHLAKKSKHHIFCAPSDAPPRDELLAMLLLDYRPKTIAKYHEHEPLLENIEGERLTPEEEQQAWEEAYRKAQEGDASASTATGLRIPSISSGEYAMKATAAPAVQR